MKGNKIARCMTFALVILLIGSSFAGIVSNTVQGSIPPSETVTADDGWGYNVTDTVSFWWHPIGTEDVATGIGNDNWTNVELGFEFRFYGVDYDSVNINSDGWLSFTDIAGYQQTALSESFNTIVSPYSTTLDITTGEIYYNQTSDAFIVTWDNVADGANQQTFQVVLNKTGEIWFNYQSISSPNAFVGIENQDSTIGIDYDHTNLVDAWSVLFLYEDVPDYRLNTSPYVSTGTGDIGEELWLGKNIYNLGSENDTYDLWLGNPFWDAEIYDSNKSHIIDNVTISKGESENIYIKLVVGSEDSGSIGTLSVESQNSDTPVWQDTPFTAYNKAPILLVDDDNGLSSEDWYMASLDENGLNYNYWDHSSLGTPDTDLMSEHRVVIWFTGLTYGADTPTLDGTDRAKIGTFLDNGGRFYLSGVYCLYDSSTYSNRWDSWSHRYLKANWLYDDYGDYGSIQFDAVVNDPISHGFNITVYDGDYYGDLDTGTYYIETVGDGTHFYTSSGGTKYPAVRAEYGDFKTIHTGFEFSGVSGLENRTELMYRMLNWLADKPGKPSNPSPSDGDMKVDVNPLLSVDIQHPEGIEVDVEFYNATSDVLIDSVTDVTSGSRVSVEWSGLKDGREYEWYAIAKDDLNLENRSETWNFSTNYIPNVSLVSPVSESSITRYDSTLRVNVSDGNIEEMNVTFYDAIEDSEIGSVSNVPSGTDAYMDWNNLSWGTSYSWYTEVDDGVSVTTSPTWTFTTKTPSIMLLSPDNEETGVDNSVTLSVNLSDEGGDTLDVKFYDSADDQEIGVVTDTEHDGNATLEWENLSWGTVYEWYVKIFDGDIFYTSSTWSFRTNIPPMQPGRPSPSQDEMGFETAVTLSVKLTDHDGDDMDVTFYDAEDDSILGTDTGVSSGEYSSVEWSGLSYETTYQWYVVADDGMTTTSSVIWSFSTNFRPDMPYNPSPENDATGTSLNLSLSVRVSDPDGDIMTVTFYNAGDDSEIGTVTNISSDNQASITWSDLAPDTTYEWYAVASDGILESDESTTWQFTTGVDNFAPDVPSDPRPSDDSDNVALNPTLSVLVSDPDGDDMTVTFYDADDNEIGNVTGIGSGIRASLVWSDLEMETTYGWYAIADDGVFTTASPTWEFTTGTGNDAPDEPTNPSPEDEAVGVRTNPTLSVDVSDPNADSLTVTFYDASDDTVIDTATAASGTTASVTWSNLDTETTYQWYAIADDGMETSTSPTWQFTTRGPNTAPSKPTSAEPADGTEISGTTSTISVLVSDDDGDMITVTFYDASDDSVIGTATAPSGSRASVTWSNLESGKTYEWYAVADDDEDSERSETYSFNTESEGEDPDGSNMGLWIGAIALIIVLILIAIVVVKKKGTGSEPDESIEEPYEDEDFVFEDEELFEEDLEETEMDEESLFDEPEDVEEDLFD